jgi:hypothetical protein
MKKKCNLEWRSKLLRQIAEVRAELDRLDRPGEKWAEDQQRRDELKRRIAEMWERFVVRRGL